MKEARGRWSFQSQAKDFVPKLPISLGALVEQASQQEPCRSLLEIAQRHEDLWSEDFVETILLFETDAPQQVRQAVEVACQFDPYHFFSYKVLVDHRLGENATLLVQQSNPRPGFTGARPSMDAWMDQLEQVGWGKRVEGVDWYTLHAVCSIAGGMAYLYDFRTVEALDEHQADLWRVSRPHATRLDGSASEGTPLQYNMFTGDLVDNRTRRQKQLDRQQERPKQLEMFSSREVAQFGVNAHPLLPLSPNMKLLLISEDPRTEEEIERDRERAAEEQTYQMFDEGTTGSDNQ